MNETGLRSVCGVRFFCEIIMAFVEPKYSREKVNQAGKILSNPSEFTSEERMVANEILGNWRASHAYPMNTFQATLRAKLEKVDSDWLVAQRLKRTPSIIGKLQRFNGMRLTQMQDIGGLRAVVDSVTKVRSLERSYYEGRWQHELKPSKDYIKNPKVDGYRGVHLRFKYKNKKVPVYDGLLLEVQLRTRLQHAWATAVETMGTFLGQALKSGQGDDLWREFFASAGAAFSHVEGAPPVPGYEGFSKYESFQSLAELEAKLNVLDKLRSFSVAADKISGSKKQASYHLIVLDSLNKTVQITPYSKQDLDKANKEYGLIEQRIADGDKKEAVLVSAGPVEELKRAYPNYFLDTQSFINRVRRLISESKKVRLSASGEGVVTSLESDVVNKIQVPRLRKKEIPQADRFSSIRQTLELIDAGAESVEAIHQASGIGRRHVSYRIAAAEILGALCRDNRLQLTMSGLAWIRTQGGSEDETVLIREMVEGTSFFAVICPNLLSVEVPGKQEIASRLELFTGLSRSTAERRAGTILSWAAQLNQYGLRLKNGK